MPLTSPRSPAPIWPQYLGTTFAGGSGFLCMTLALEGVSPGQVAWARAILGALALLALSLAVERGQLRLPRSPRDWRDPIVLGLVFLSVPYHLLAWSQQHLPTNISAVLNALTPILTLFFAVAVFRSDTARRIQVIAMCVGVAGVAVMAAPWASGSSALHPGGLLACLLAVGCFGFGMSYMRAKVDRSTWPGMSLTVAASLVAAAVALVTTPWILHGPVTLTPRVVTGILVLGIVGTGLALLWSYNVITAWGAATAASAQYLSPVIGVALGFAILGEVLRPHEAIGAVITVIAVVLARPGRAG